MPASFPRTETDPAFTAAGATDAELAALEAALEAADALKQDASTAATDAELTAVQSGLQVAVALKQDASTAATDAELSAAQSALQTAINLKQDASTAATDAEVAAIQSTLQSAINSEASRATTAEAAKQDTATADDRLPKLISFPAWTGGRISVAGTWTPVNSAAIFGVTYLQSAGAQNEEIAYDIVLAAGTWEITFWTQKQNNMGVYSVRVENVEVGTFDAYNAASTGNNAVTISNVTVASTGKKRVSIKMATKNGSSSGYFALIQGVITLRRTA